MTRYVFLAAAVLALAACRDDDPLRATRADGPLSPLMVEGVAPSAGSLAGSSVCTSYRAELNMVSAELESAPADTTLQQARDVLSEIITDVCN